MVIFRCTDGMENLMEESLEKVSFSNPFSIRGSDLIYFPGPVPLDMPAVCR